MHTEPPLRAFTGDEVAVMPTICAAFQATAARYPSRLALRLPGEQIEWSWDEYAARVRRAAQTLHALGVRRRDRVALLLRNRPEHLLADLATVHLGAIPFSIYATSAPPDVEYTVRDSGARVLITEAAFETTVAAVAPRCGGLEHVLRLTSGAPELDGVVSPAFDFERSWRKVTPQDLVCLVYTSQTTGPPNAAEITHHGVLANLRRIWPTLPIPNRVGVISFLPLAHLAERFTSHYAAIVLARTVTCCPDAAAFAAALAQTGRTPLGAPPRVSEIALVAQDPDLAAVYENDTARASDLARAVSAANRAALALCSPSPTRSSRPTLRALLTSQAPATTNAHTHIVLVAAMRRPPSTRPTNTNLGGSYASRLTPPDGDTPV